MQTKRQFTASLLLPGKKVEGVRHGVMTGLLKCPGVVTNLWRGGKEHTQKQDQNCGKRSPIVPPVRSSQFPGPDVCVWGAITHQLPPLPLSACCVLWHSPLSYSCRVCSFPMPWLAQRGKLEGRRWQVGPETSSSDELGSRKLDGTHLYHSFSHFLHSVSVEIMTSQCFFVFFTQSDTHVFGMFSLSMFMNPFLYLTVSDLWQLTTLSHVRVVFCITHLQEL